MVLPVTSDIYLTDVLGKTPLLGHLLSGLHVRPLPTEAGWGGSCADPWLKPQKFTQEHPGPVPVLPPLLPRLPDSPALPAQLGRCQGKSAHTPSMVLMRLTGPLLLQEQESHLLGAQCPRARGHCEHTGRCKATMRWFTQRVTEHAPWGPRGDTGRGHPQPHLPNTPSHILVLFSLTKGLHL